MDDLISGYVQDQFPDELGEQINRSFDLFDFFEYKQAFSGFVDILMNASNSSSDMLQDQFIIELNEKLDFVLNQHMVKLVSEATIEEKNEILTALARLQSLEDYTGIIRTLETFATDEEQFAIIVSDITALQEERVMTLIEELSPEMLRGLKTYIYQIEEQRETSPERNLKLIDGFKLLTEAIGKDNTGTKLLENGILPGQKFETYLTFAEGALLVNGNNVKSAENILSVIALSIDGYNAPLTVYRKYSYHITNDLNLVTEIEVKMLDLMAKYSELKKAYDEKNRLSTDVLKS